MAPLLFLATETGSNQFSGEVTDFLGTFSEIPSQSSVIILGYAYNSQGSAHDVNLYLAESASADADEQIVLEERTGINSFTNACGKGGTIVVPKDSPTGASYVLLLDTTGKDGDATFQVWYTVENL